ncbi:hypothetical protein POL68_16930 [Stigmatella sp. ncwal1]|uniref:Uncharacterized protein n=1 Tax=Stigmatella ashevillensis TaxID=2995309 RepID=A0ABT5D946_9BACT|nr:hypothetical protein [Stigmatella ashevillena]MDC0710164.1 hypothetical protein [Stigmatella ashevillena]
MKTALPRVPRGLEVLRGLWCALFLGFLAMWPLSYSFYTSFGIDTDRQEELSAIQAHLRFRWPGNGSFMVGADQFWLAAWKPLDRFDLGGAFFKAPRRPPLRSSWNQMGFWAIRERYPPSKLPLQVSEMESSSWIGVPSWLPVVLTGFWPVRWWMDPRKGKVLWLSPVRELMRRRAS